MDPKEISYFFNLQQIFPADPDTKELAKKGIILNFIRMAQKDNMDQLKVMLAYLSMMNVQEAIEISKIFGNKNIEKNILLDYIAPNAPKDITKESVIREQLLGIDGLNSRIWDYKHHGEEIARLLFTHLIYDNQRDRVNYVQIEENSLLVFFDEFLNSVAGIKDKSLQNDRIMLDFINKNSCMVLEPGWINVLKNMKEIIGDFILYEENKQYYETRKKALLGGARLFYNLYDIKNDEKAIAEKNIIETTNNYNKLGMGKFAAFYQYGNVQVQTISLSHTDNKTTWEKILQPHVLPKWKKIKTSEGLGVFPIGDHILIYDENDFYFYLRTRLKNGNFYILSTSRDFLLHHINIETFEFPDKKKLDIEETIQFESTITYGEIYFLFYMLHFGFYGMKLYQSFRNLNGFKEFLYVELFER